jgi:preprotein translocase SecF subunit
VSNFDFIGRRPIWFAFSAVVIAVGLVALVLQGLVFGIEFKGGALFEVKFDHAASVSEVREAVKPIGLGDSVIQLAGKDTVFLRTAEMEPEQQDQVKKALTGIGAVDFTVQQVGGSWGARLSQGTVVALMLALFIVLSFVAVRFEFKMGMAAVAALGHDVLIVVGVYALLGREVSTATVAAFLTLLGYSVYDTIVVFDRVRENSVGIHKHTYSQMVNRSIHQSLRRTVSTSLTSIIPVTMLLIFGGETLKDFALALLVGLVSGTYSTIFIASPLLAMWKESEPKYQVLRKKLTKASPRVPA